MPNNNRRSRIVLLCSCLVAGPCVVALAAFVVRNSHQKVATLLAPTPWASVGGCGAGGSGGGGGGAKWVGMGATGGLVDLQLMYSNSIGQNFFNSSFSPRFSFKPVYVMTIGLSTPIVSKIAEVQPTTVLFPEYFITGGTGDISVDYSYTFGMSGEYSLNLALAFPTGQYNIKRGSDARTMFLPTGLQKGTGVYNGSLGFSYSKDVEDGMWLFDVSYAHPFNMKLFTGENEFNDEYYTDYADIYRDAEDSEVRSRFFYRFKPYGENDLGDFVPPSISGSVYYGYKRLHGYVFSWGMTFSAPFAVAWIHEEAYNGQHTVYNPRPDPDHKAWNSSLNFGMEVSKPKFPFFVAIALPIHDRGAPSSTRKVTVDGVEKEVKDVYAQDPYNEDYYRMWDPPDWKDFCQQWSFAIGLKATLF